VANDVAALDRFFLQRPSTIRYGVTENLYGYGEIAAFRATRSPAGLARTLERPVITTYGRDFAVAATLFRARDDAREGGAADADLGEDRRRLARSGRACEPDRRAGGLNAPNRLKGCATVPRDSSPREAGEGDRVAVEGAHSRQGGRK